LLKRRWEFVVLRAQKISRRPLEILKIIPSNPFRYKTEGIFYMNKKENQNSEFKESWHDDYMKWVSGFCNASGGKIYIGVNDNGDFVGLKNAKKLLEDIPNKLVQHLGVVCDVNLKVKNKLEYIEIKVPKYTVPISYNGKYYFRSGATKQELKGKALEQFLLKKSGKTWDSMPENGVTLKEIDAKALAYFKKLAVNSLRLKSIKSERSTVAILDNLHLLDKKSVKRAAVLSFGKNPQKNYLGAIIKIGRFGKSDDDLLYQDLIEGNIYEMTEKTLSVLRQKYFMALIRYEGLYRKEEFPYPISALREAILNAVVHRDYSGDATLISVYDDKLVIWNDGELHEEITLDDLKTKHPSRPNNPKIAELFYKGGLIEAWGRGTLNIIRECKEYTTREPLFETVSGGTQLTIFSKASTIDNSVRLNSRQLKSLEYLKLHGSITNSIYQRINETNYKSAYRDLNQLVKLNYLVKEGPNKQLTLYKLR
jgi:ATP-dependent DNA helicase RecG